MSPWTDDRVKLLIQLRQDGESFTKIGHALGVSRGAVAGKLDRLHNPGRDWETYVKERSLWTESKLVERWADRKARKTA